MSFVAAGIAGNNEITGLFADAKAYYEHGEFNVAVIQLKNALRIDPNNADARLLLGKSYLELEDWLSAEKELTRARDLGVEREEILEPLGQAWLMTGQHDRLLQEIISETGDSKPSKFTFY